MKLSLALIFAVFTAVCAVPITKEEIKSKSTQGLRLLSLAEDAQPIWVTESEMMQLIQDNVGFVRVSNFSSDSFKTRLTSINPKV